jgi:hypothetical protein
LKKVYITEGQTNIKEIYLKNLSLLLSAVYLLAVFPLFSQELAEGEQEQQEPPSDELYVIVAFEYDILGRTRPNALAYRGEFKVGEVLRGMTGLEEYIREKTQILINQRMLKDNSAMTYFIGEQQEDGAYPVVIVIMVEDSWNIIALPYPKYSSNSGLEVIIKARDYNFLGSMNPLRVDLGYYRDENGRNSFFLGVESNTPFTALGYNWNIKFNNIFSYRPDVYEPYYYQNVTGISMELPFRRTTFTFGFEESFNVNEENVDRYKDRYPEFQSGLFMSSKLYTTWEIPTGITVSRFGELTYIPIISATFNHEFPNWPLQDIRKGPFLDFTHSLGFEKINWHVNYREGLSASLSNSYTYDFFRLNNDQNPLSASFTLTGKGHFIISSFFGFSSRIQYRHWFYNDPDYYEQASDVLRGIADKAISADYMLSLNLDFPLRVMLFKPSKWFNTRKLSFFDFEMHLSPVFDIAMYHDPQTETSFNFNNTLITGGLELIAFPDFMRNLFLRICFAWNVRAMFDSRPYKIPGGQNREISLIIGHFY